MLSIVICDDMLDVAKSLKHMVEASIPRRMDYEIRTFTSSQNLIEAVENGLTPNIALLDIVLGEESGIQLAKRLFPSGFPTQVIFITGHMEYCTPVYETEHIYFLLKPVKPKELQQALNKALERQNHGPEKQLILRSRMAIQRIPLSDIHYIESNARKVVIHYGDTRCEHYSTLADLLPQLPGNFVHCHKSYCVNMDYVERMEADRFILFDKKPIAISQAKKAATRKRFLEYWDRVL